MAINSLDFDKPMLGVTFRSLFGYDKFQAWEANMKWNIGGEILEDGEIMFSVQQVHTYIQSLLSEEPILRMIDPNHDDWEFLVNCIKRIPHLISIQNDPASAEWQQLLRDDRMREALSPSKDEGVYYYWGNEDAEREADAE